MGLAPGKDAKENTCKSMAGDTQALSVLRSTATATNVSSDAKQVERTAIRVRIESFAERRHRVHCLANLVFDGDKEAGTKTS